MGVAVPSAISLRRVIILVSEPIVTGGRPDLKRGASGSTKAPIIAWPIAALLVGIGNRSGRARGRAHVTGADVRAPLHRGDAVLAGEIDVGLAGDQHRRLAGGAAGTGDEVPRLGAGLDPVVDFLDAGQIDIVDGMGRNRAQPFGQPVPLLLGEEAFGIALVGGVRQQQRDHILQAADFGDPCLFGASA